MLQFKLNPALVVSNRTCDHHCNTPNENCNFTFTELQKLLLPRISQMTSLALACDLRQALQNKGILPNHAKVTGEPDG